MKTNKTRKIFWMLTLGLVMLLSLVLLSGCEKEPDEIPKYVVFSPKNGVGQEFRVSLREPGRNVTSQHELEWKETDGERIEYVYTAYLEHNDEPVERSSAGYLSYNNFEEQTLSAYQILLVISRNYRANAHIKIKITPPLTIEVDDNGAESFEDQKRYVYKYDPNKPVQVPTVKMFFNNEEVEEWLVLDESTQTSHWGWSADIFDSNEVHIGDTSKAQTEIQLAVGKYRIEYYLRYRYKATVVFDDYIWHLNVELEIIA